MNFTNKDLLQGFQQCRQEITELRRNNDPTVTEKDREFFKMAMGGTGNKRMDEILKGR